jgi:hypothetical protein
VTNWSPGDRCRVVEHDDATREPKPGGKVLPATVTGAGGIYVRAEFNDPEWPGKPVTMAFYADSGWAAWDGLFCWRLLPGTDEEAATAAGSVVVGD